MLRDIPSPRFFESSSISSISLLPGELVGKVCGYYYELHDAQGLARAESSRREDVKKLEDRLRIPLERGNEAIVAAANFVGDEQNMPKPIEL